MGRFVEVGKKGDLVNGTMREVKVEGHDILLARVADKYYAINNRCPHFGGNLSRGHLEGTVITCPLHGSQFDISNGEVIRWLKGSGPISAIGRVLKSPRSLNTYQVSIKDNKILVKL